MPVPGSTPDRGGAAARMGVMLLAAAFGSACLRTPTRPVLSAVPPNVTPSPTFELEGKPFCFGGSSNYYAIYKPRPVVDDLFAAARALDLRVMRVWGMLDRGSLDGRVPNADPAGGDKEGVYFQYWDPVTQAPAYNDGQNGLERLDYALAKAAALNLKLIIVLVNNWRAFGGIDQYLMWYGRDRHQDFFTAPEVRRAYENWVTHVVTRKNRITGMIYRDDPVIFAWELANEPRTRGDDPLGGGSSDPSALTAWAREMSAYIKALDPNHLVSVGDEGFLNTGGEHWAYRATDGVDHRALSSLPAVDFGTFHLYPDDWGVSAAWGEQWISDHLELARAIAKPALLEEYGVKVTRVNGTTGDVVNGWRERESAYRRWNELLLRRGGSGFLPWMLAGSDEPNAGEPVPHYPDYDHYVFYRDDATGRLIGDYARRFLDAPACGNQPASAAPASPFVRVRRAPEHVAFGWVAASE